jgi:hypothetical protein
MSERTRPEHLTGAERATAPARCRLNDETAILGPVGGPECVFLSAAQVVGSHV